MDAGCTSQDQLARHSSPSSSPHSTTIIVVLRKYISLDISNKNANLLSMEKASATASAASATISSTPWKSRPITTLFLLTVVSFLPSFHYCVRAHHHHPVCSSRHHRCQPLGQFLLVVSPSLALLPAFSLSLSVSLRLPFSREYRSTTTTIYTALERWSLLEPRKTTRSSSAFDLHRCSREPITRPFSLSSTLSFPGNACTCSFCHSLSFLRLQKPRDKKNIPRSGETDRPAPYATTSVALTRYICPSPSLPCLSCTLRRFDSGGLLYEMSTGASEQSLTQKLNNLFVKNYVENKVTFERFQSKNYKYITDIKYP